jgi:divalent metal cation (Fe/Co/Zn/Cd) transporter
MTSSVHLDVRGQALRKARRLNALTIGWNVVEAAVALSAGVAAGSLSLVAFGLDSCVEV